MKSDIQRMIEDCQSAIDIPASRGGPGFNDWEKGFLESIADQYEESGRLSEKQKTTLEKLWDRV